MVERNLLREGYIFNTLDALGVVSGTQTVPIDGINKLVDGDVSTTAVTVSGAEFFSLDADLGGRWKLDRIELYTDETQPLNFDMFISDDGLDFNEITMTGSPGLYVGDISPTSISGAPRYIRYEHRGATDRNIQEWRAVSDDALVQFGDSGTQEEAIIEDAPIGKPSDFTTRLSLFNAYNKPAVGNVVIAASGSGANNIEISLSPNGPWYGRKTLSAKQPDILGWELGNFDGTRVVSGTAYKSDWSDGTKGGWSVSGFAGSSVVDYNSTAPSFRGQVSTSTTPTFHLDNNFSNAVSSVSPLSSNKPTGFACRADEFDRVRVNLTTPTIPAGDFVEGVRLFWRNHTGQSYNTGQSTLSTAQNSNFSGVPQEFIFDVGAIPTWSGVIRSIKIQNFTTNGSMGYSSSLNEVEIYHSSRKDRVGLNFSPIVSGTFFGSEDPTYHLNQSYYTVINTENPVLEPCIITMVTAEAYPGSRDLAFGSEDLVGWFLVSFKDGHSLPSPGDNFEVKAFASTPGYAVNYFYTMKFRLPVFWKAEPGDMVGFAWRYNTYQLKSSWVYDTSPTNAGVHGGALISTGWVDTRSSQSLAGAKSELDALTFTGYARRYNIQFEGISAGKYLQNGNYTSPVVDGGSTPALLSIDFETTEENGTSIDSFTGGAFKTISARASATPPRKTNILGRKIASVDSNVAYLHDYSVGKGLQRDYDVLARRYPVGSFALGPHPWPGVAPGANDPLDFRFTTHSYALGAFNSEATNRQTETGFEGYNDVENVGRCLFYHELKDELWILNLIVSGTSTYDARPIWDVYNIDTGDYIRTQHMTGTVNYTFQNVGAGSNATWAFEPVAFIPDYEREEIFIISREHQFAIGAGAYYGLIMDLEGEYKNVIFRRDVLLSEMVNKEVESDTTAAARHLQQARCAAYDGKYFFILTNNSSLSYDEKDDYGYLLDVFRLGDDVNDEPDTAAFITSIDLRNVPGTDIISTGLMEETAQAIAYNEDDGLLYYIVPDSPRIATLSYQIIGSQPSETVVVVDGPIREETNHGIDNMPDYLIESFKPSISSHYRLGDYPYKPNGWSGAGWVQFLGPILDLAYIPSRKTFVELMCYSADRDKYVVRNGHYRLDYFLFRGTYHSFVQEITAVTPPQINVPGMPGIDDPLWGALSGTLSYEPVQVGSVLFPTGRYAQIQYQLNSDPSGFYSPYLLNSQITQGLRVGDIPVSGTKDIYLRTNIPFGTSIDAQQSNLNVFWELEE